MKYSEILALSALVASSAARPALHSSPLTRIHARDMKMRREVPQEQSHKKFLTKAQEMLLLDNPDEIQDTVFGLLGNEAAAQGIGNIADADCLQQASADQAFTNAVAAGDVEGQVAALIYRTLERNTGSVGLASVACTAIDAVNPEIAALQQHQDPASDGAADLNKEITLELARQIASVGGDPLEALQSGTFEPGDLGDETGAGNTCNEEDDAEGCIFTENLLVEDASEEEIMAAVADVDGADVAAAQVDDEAAAQVDDEADANATNVDRNVNEANKNNKYENQQFEKIDDKNIKENDKDKILGGQNAKQFKDQAIQNVNFNDRNLQANVNILDQFIFNDFQFQQQLVQFQQLDVVIIQQQFAQIFQQVQFQAWQQIAIQQFILEQQIQQQIINQQIFLQQQLFFQQQIVQQVIVFVQQRVDIIVQNVNVINLGGFDFIQQNFIQQIGGLDSLQNLFQIGGINVQQIVQIQQLFGGNIGNIGFGNGIGF